MSSGPDSHTFGSFAKESPYCKEVEILGEEAESNRLQMNELSYLATVFSRSTAIALQRGAQGDWIKLIELLQIMQPIGSVLIELSEVKHYVERLCQHIVKNNEKVRNIRLKEVLGFVFGKCQPENTDEVFPSWNNQANFPSREKKHVKLPKTVEDMNDLFQLNLKETEGKLKSQPLKLDDIQRYLPRIVSEISRQESVWSNTLGLSLLTANVCLPYSLQSVISDTINSGTVSTVETTDSEECVQGAQLLPQTGTQVVEYIIKHESMDDTKIWFLNQNVAENFDPYDLVVVSRTRICLEHYVMSVFGVLHVKPVGQSELITLGQWYREAIVFRTMRKIKYFGTYLVLKTFTRWKKNVAFVKFLKSRKQIERTHLLGVPQMMSAILKVKSLLLEMQGVKLLPSEHQICYTLSQFNQTVMGMVKRAKMYISKLYNHFLSILRKVETGCYEYLHYCLVQSYQKTENVKESMNLARKRRNMQKKNLNFARYIEEKLPNFASLLDKMLNHFLLSFVYENIQEFVEKMMQAENSERKGLFWARFEFDPESCLLSLSPNSNELMEFLRSCFSNIPCELGDACLAVELSEKDARKFNGSDHSITGRNKLDAAKLRGILNSEPKHQSKPLDKCNNNFQTVTEDVFNKKESAGLGCKSEQSKARLNADILVKECTELMGNLMESAFEEVDAFAKEHGWIANIYSFVKTWDHEMLFSWKGQPASKIEKQVQQIRNWVDQVQNIQVSVRTSNGLLFVDNTYIQYVIVPGLEKIFSSLMDMTATDCFLSSEKLILDLADISKNLTTGTLDIEEFAMLYQRVAKLKETSTTLQQREEYVKSIFEIVRHCYRQLTPREEEIEEKVVKEWNMFLYVLQDASNRVNEMLPQMIENINYKISSLEGEAIEITEKLGSGRFLDANMSSKIILPELKEMHARFKEVKEELILLVKYKSIIEGEVHDLSSLSALYTRLLARYELWKYCEVISFAIKDWMHTLFCKIRKVSEKVMTWRVAVRKLQHDLPPNDDVLSSLIMKIEEFGQNIPFLQDLSSVSLKEQHWKWLFAGFGAVYNPSNNYIVSDFISFGLKEHSQLIMSICDSAAAEYALESHLKKLIKRWEEEEFKLMKYRWGKQTGQTEPNVTLTTSKASVLKCDHRGAGLPSDCYILTGINELQYEVLSNLVTLQSMLVSPHLAEMRTQAETWSGHLHQLTDVLDLWTSCQEKWLYLKNFFSHVTSSHRVAQLFQEFNDIDLKYQEHMSAVQKDPMVLSVLEKKKCEHGYRHLQGEVLREELLVLIAAQERIIKNLDTYISSIRASFPRLYFMSNNEMLQVLAISRNPKGLVPFVRKCFPGIINLKFALPLSVANSIRTPLDATLNGHRLEVVSIYGELSEEINLPNPIAPAKSVDEWLSSIELAMKSRLFQKISQCIEERLLCNPSLQKLARVLGIAQYSPSEATAVLNSSSSRTPLSFGESDSSCWYVLYPMQCILTTEDFVWTHNLERAVINRCVEAATGVCQMINDNIQQCCTVLQSYFIEDPDKYVSNKVMMLIQNLLVRYLYHREVTEEIVHHRLDESSMRWFQTYRYEVEISHDKMPYNCVQSCNTNLVNGSTASSKFGKISISNLGFSTPYRYEYQEPTSRLIITPLTDRALLNLTSAMNLHYIGGLCGATESGKTETIHEISKIYGSHLVFFTCGPSISLSTILQYVSGAVQSGSLLCFENVDKLPSNILAVFGQHLNNIRQSLLTLKNKQFGHIEIRDPNLSKKQTDEKVTARKRHATVISLHAQMEDGTYSTTTEDQMKSIMTSERNHMPRRHSVGNVLSNSDTTVEPKEKIFDSRGSASGYFLTGIKGNRSDESDFVCYHDAKPLGDVLVGGVLVAANPLFSCMLTLSSANGEHPSIPDSLKNATRICGTITLDYQVIIEVLLLIHGFKSSGSLAKKTSSFMDLSRSQSNGRESCGIYLSHIKKIIFLAKKFLNDMKLKKALLHSDSSLELNEGEKEELCIGKAIYKAISSSIDPTELFRCMRLLERSFPQIKSFAREKVIEDVDDRLLSSVKQQVLSDSLYAKEDFILKVMQLHEILVVHRSVILLGDPGTGKSTCYQTLSRALCQFSSVWAQAVKKRRHQAMESSASSEKENFVFSNVQLSTFYHKAMTTEELYGGYSESQNWFDGILAKTIRTATQLQCAREDGKPQSSTRDSIQHWFVLDGPLDPGTSEPLESLLDLKRELMLANGERLKPSESVRFLFETSHLSHASPAIMARSAVVNFKKNMVDWKCLLHSWKKSAKNRFRISIGVKVVKEMISHVNDPLAEFLSKESVELLSSVSSKLTAGKRNCYTDIASILQLLGAILQKFAIFERTEQAISKKSLSRLNEVDHNSHSNISSKNSDEVRFISNAFAFAFVWAVSGRLHESCYQAFDVFTRQLFATCPYSIIFPCSIFDCILDDESYELVRWKYNGNDLPRAFPTQNFFPTVETEKCFSIADLLVSFGGNVIIIGDIGVGKTSFVQNVLRPKYKMHSIGFCHGLSPKIFQKVVKNYVEEQENLRRSNSLKPHPREKGLVNDNNILFIDDISMGAGDSGYRYTQSTLEVLREMISEGRVYDHGRKYFEHLPNLQFLATSIPYRSFGDSTKGRVLSPRLTRRMNTVNMRAFSNESLCSIYTNVYRAWLQEFPSYSFTHRESLAKAMAYASVDMFNFVKKNFTLSSINPEYLFSHSDLARVAKGVVLYSPRSRYMERRPEKSRCERSNASCRQSIPTGNVVEHSSCKKPSVPIPKSPGTLSCISSGNATASYSPLVRTLIRLWCHEVYRSFYDRIKSEEERSKFSEVLNNVVAEYFCGKYEDVFAGDFSSQEQTHKSCSKPKVKFNTSESSGMECRQEHFSSFVHLFGESKKYPANTIFSKHLSSYRNAGTHTVDHEKGYVECVEEDVEDALRKSMNLIKSADGNDIDLVLYKEALHHAVRISRALALPGGHALLLSMNGHGRANTVRLVAALASMKIFRVSGAALNDRLLLRSIIKSACIVAGLQGKPVILYVAENLCKEGLKDIAALIAYGNCPGLFTIDEEIDIGDKLLPRGRGDKRRSESKAGVPDRFTRRVIVNLHIVLCARYESLNDFLVEFPCILSKASCIDIYLEWTTDILEKVAEKWLISKGDNYFFSNVLWYDRSLQMKAIYSAMAQIHCSARIRLDVRRLGIEIFSPLKFVEFVDLFRYLCNIICQERQAELNDMDKAIEKIEECKRDIGNAENSIRELLPTLSAAKHVLKTSEENVLTATNEYQNSKQACIDQQQEIERLEQPLGMLRAEAQQDFHLLSPMYEAAMNTLKSLDIYHIEEMRSYRDPPAGVKFVGDILCEMFDKSASWEEAKHLLMKDNFFQDLLFYDKDCISDALFAKIEKFCTSSGSDPEKLIPVSKAASSISLWVRAINDYCCCMRKIKPNQLKLTDSEMELTKVKMALGEKRVLSHKRKMELESHIQVYKDMLKQTKALEKQLQILKRGKHKAECLLSEINSYTENWCAKVNALKGKLRSAPGDALLTAATIIYLAMFNEDMKEQVRDEWIDLIDSGFNSMGDAPMIPIDHGHSMIELLSTDDEQMEWKEKKFPIRYFMLADALTAWTCCIGGKKCWPLFIDPHNYAPSLVRCIEDLLSSRHAVHPTANTNDSGVQDMNTSSPSSGRVISEHKGSVSVVAKPESNEVTHLSAPPPFTAKEVLQVVNADDNHLDGKLKTAVAHGLPTLVPHLERKVDGTILDTLLNRSMIAAANKTPFIIHENQRLECHPNFRLYTSATVSINYIQSHRFALPLHRTFVINLTIGRKELESLLTSHAVYYEKPELVSQKRSLELDLLHLRKERIALQNGVREKLCAIPGKIMDDLSLQTLIGETTKQLDFIEQQIEEGEKFQLKLDEKMHGYRQIASQSSFLYRIVQQVLLLKPFYEPSLQFFEEQFKRTLADCERINSEAGSTISRVAEVTFQFSLDLYKRICLHVFKEHVSFYSLFVAIHQCTTNGRTKEMQLHLFLKFCGMTESYSFLTVPDFGSFPSGWLTEEVVSRISCIDGLDCFKGLLESFTTYLNQWKEYFSMPINLASSCPCGFQNLTTFYKALLWLVVFPSKRSIICQSLISIILGPDFTKLFNHSLNDILNISNRNTPILICLPTGCSSSKREDPVLALQGLGKMKKIPVTTISLGMPEQLKKAEMVIGTSFNNQRRKWIILENCHLETRWSKEFLRLIEDMADHRSQRSAGEEQNADDHISFRIWFIFSCHKDMKIPFPIAKGGVQVAWDDKSYDAQFSLANLPLNDRDVNNLIRSLMA